jgi:sugar phosphate isomerase/epimerase
MGRRFQVTKMSANSSLRLAVLNSMAGSDIEASLDQQIAWGIRDLDLKDSIWGKSVLHLESLELGRLTKLIEARSMSVQCVSTTLFHGHIEEGETELRQQILGPMDRLIQVSRALRPRFVRLLGARTRQAVETRALLLSHDPKLDWLFALYREAIDRLAAAGLMVTIENETNGCILCDGDTVRAFFERLDRSGRAVFTWDVQNMWHCGAFPSLAIYEQVKPFLAYYHVKGGQSERGGSALRYKSTLEEASWPVLSITRKVVSDGVSPVICLNPSHGEKRPGYDEAHETERDLAFLRREIRVE